jgi:hypothetical protein
VNRDVPERGRIEVAQVFVLAVGGHDGSASVRVVVGAACLALERTRGPHAGERPPVELGEGATTTASPLGSVTRPATEELQQLVELLASHVRERAGLRCCSLAARHVFHGRRISQLGRVTRNACCTSFNSRSAMVSSFSALRVIPSSSLQLLPRSRSRPSRNDALARGARSPRDTGCSAIPPWPRRSTCPPDRRGCADRRAREKAFGRSRSMKDSTPRQVSRTGLDEDPWCFLDVVRCRLDKARHLTQLRHHPAARVRLPARSRTALATRGSCRAGPRTAADSCPTHRTTSTSWIRPSMWRPPRHGRPARSASVRSSRSD